MCAGDLRHGVPVVAPAVGRDETVGHDKIEQAVVVQVSESRSPRPAGIRHDAGRNLIESIQLLEEIDAEVVALKKKAALRDVRDKNVQEAPIVDVAKSHRHAA